MSPQSSHQDMSALNVPHKVHHFVTGKTLIMFVAFVATVGIAVGSYIYLLNKTQQTHPSIPEVVTPSLNKKTATFANPQEFTDDSLSFFYPGTMIIDTKSDTTISWKIKTAGDSYMTNALILTKQTTPFTQPQNGDNNHTPTQYFSIDDTQARYINNLTVKEYTVNCGIDCDYRLDQFSVGPTYYQLYFDTSKAGLSAQAEEILNTLRDKTVSVTTTPQSSVVCTQEAKLCSDGSYVSRQGPNCAFAACPN